MSALSQTTHEDGLRANEPRVSVVINNYNYAAYLGEAIDSALHQDYAQKEIVVVDDGSTDGSRDAIAAYGSQIIPIFKANGGQASALNAGFAASRGEVILFLDADDFLLPCALSNVIHAFHEPSILNVHWSMWIVDSQGNRAGDTRPPHPPDQGDFRKKLLERGPSNLPCSPTSGNAWSRAFLQRVMPIPEDVEYYRKCADEYLYNLGPAFGSLRTIVRPQSCYRIHGRNIYSGSSFREKLDLELKGYDQQCSAVSKALERNGVQVDVKAWKQHSWFHRLDRAVADILATVPDESSVVLVEGEAWDAGGAFGGRSVRPFLQIDGNDWGPPPDSDAAIAQFATLRREGIDYFAIGWSSFWWFDEYPGFIEHLEDVATCVVRNDDVVIYHVAPNDEELPRQGTTRACVE